MAELTFPFTFPGTFGPQPDAAVPEKLVASRPAGNLQFTRNTTVPDGSATGGPLSVYQSIVSAHS